MVEHVDRKEKGYIVKLNGKVTATDVSSDINSSIYLYPDKIMINQKQIVPLLRIKYCRTFRRDESFVYRGSKIKREYPALEIHYDSLDGNQSIIRCIGRKNAIGNDYINFKLKLNNLIGYKEPIKEIPDNPYEI